MNGEPAKTSPTATTEGREASTAASSPAPTDTRRSLDAFLMAVYRGSLAVGHDQAVPLAAIAGELAVGERLAHKIAAFLETEGLVDYDDQAVDITIEGMLRAEEILRGA